MLHDVSAQWRVVHIQVHCPKDICVAAPGMPPPGAMVTKADIQTCVGVIHVISTLLVSPVMSPSP
jgi:hypothetical protein